MSQALRQLRAAVREFANRPLEEDIDPEKLRDVIDELEGGLEILYDPPAERARIQADFNADLQAAVRQIRESAARRAQC